MSSSPVFKRVCLSIGLLGVIATFFLNCGKAGFSSQASVKMDTEDFTQLQTDDDPVITSKETIVTAYEPILADRHYIRSVFVSTFGPAADTVDQTRAYLNALDHGAPCSVYGDHLQPNASGVYVTADASETCSRTTLNRTVAQINPKPTVSRQALLSKACSDLVTSDITLGVAIGKIDSTVAVPEASKANVLKAFRLFYRMRGAPHDGLLESLQVMAPSTGATKESWRQVINTVCASGLWQVL